MANLEEIISFIKRYRDSIKPLTRDPEALDIIWGHTNISDILSHGIGGKRLVNILEEFETKVFVYENPDPAKYAKRVLVEAAEPLAFILMSPVVERLTSDSRCQSICLLTDNLSGKYFGEKMDVRWRRIDDHSNPMFSDIPGPFDVALVGIEPPHSPNAPLLFGAKSVFGAKKMFFIMSGWQGVGGEALFEKDRRVHMDTIDGVFCNDELAKKIFLSSLPRFPEERIYVTGTPIVDALEQDRAKLYAAAGRRKLGLGEDTTVILYLGDISGGYRKIGYQADERINERTLELTIEAIKKFALEEQEKKFALLVRPHPRDPNREGFLEIAEQAKVNTPKNLSIISAAYLDISMQEARYVSDVFLSIVSTENFLAAVRNRPAIFLGYDNNGLGKTVLDRVYGKELLEVIGSYPNLHIVYSPDGLLRSLQSLPPREEMPPFSHQEERDSIAKILDAVLS